MIPKFIIALNIKTNDSKSKDFYYSFDYGKAFTDSYWSNYFASSHFFDSIVSAAEELKTLSREDRYSMLQKILDTNKIDYKDVENVKYYISQVSLTLKKEVNPETML